MSGRLAVLFSLVLGSSAGAREDLFDTSVLRTFHLTFEQDNWWGRLVNNKNQENGKYLRATLDIDGMTLVRVGVRLRGKASYYYSNEFKKPFKIKFDEFVEDQELYGHDSIRLNNSWEDPSLMRDVLMGNLLREWMPMPQHAFAKLVINGENWGVYVAEQTKDLKYMREFWSDPSGNRYKSVQGGNLSYLGPDPNSYRIYEDKSNNGDTSKADLIELCDVINNTPDGEDLVEALRAIMELDETIWTVAGDCVFGNLDSYYVNRNNFYVIQDPRHDLVHLSNHDLGLSFGTWGGQTPEFEPTYKFDSTLIPLVKNLFRYNRMKQEYFAHVRSLVEHTFRWDRIGPMAEAHRNLIRAEVYLDDKKLWTDQQFEDSLDQSTNGQFFTIPALRDYVERRHAYLASHSRLSNPQVQFDRVEHVPAAPRAGEIVTIAATLDPSIVASKVELYWRTLGPFQIKRMRDDGTNGDAQAGDGIYSARITGLAAGDLVQYYMIGTSGGGGGRAVRFEPEGGARAAYQFDVEGATGSGLVLSEIMARNESGIVDEAGDHDDWLEISNQDSVAHDLSRMFLTDDILRPSGWRIPEGTVLQPGEQLLVWLDDEESEGPYHADFRLDASGEQVALFDPTGAELLSSIVFRAQQPDRSLGRLLDGAEPLVSFREPSPGAVNKPACGARHYSGTEVSENGVGLAFQGDPAPGQTVAVDLTGGPPGGSCLMYVGVAPDATWTPHGVWLLEVAGSLSFSLPLDAFGGRHLPFTLPDDGSLVDVDLYLQGLVLRADGSFDLSNAVELRVCP